jgi:hypothetical protein
MAAAAYPAFARKNEIHEQADNNEWYQVLHVGFLLGALPQNRSEPG